MNIIQKRILDGIRYLIPLGAAEEVIISKEKITSINPVTEEKIINESLAKTTISIHNIEADEREGSLAQSNEIIFIICLGPLDDQDFILEINDKITTIILGGGGEFRISDFILGDGANAQREVRCYKEGSDLNN